MDGQRVIIQASSMSWSGGRDYCMTIIDDHPVVYWTLKRVIENIHCPNIIIIAPEFDRDGELEMLYDSFPGVSFSIYYGQNASPLNRILGACVDLSDNDYVIRIDGVHFCFDPKASMDMLSLAKNKELDCVKLPDDFPVAFRSDIYRIGALRNLDKLLQNDTHAMFRVHPKFYMFMRNDLFNCEYLLDLPFYSDSYLSECRLKAEPITNVPRMEVDERRRITAGDQLSFHYELALEYLDSDMKVLDVACGNGFGVRLLAQKVAQVVGADIDSEAIMEANQRTHSTNTSFCIEDITCMSFGSEEFNAVISMETLEHVDAHSCLQEISRVLKPCGLLILSTPQNSMGHIPVTSCHNHEYSLKELVDLCSQYFSIKAIIGIKAGRIIIPDDPLGANTMLVCVNDK